MERPSHIAIVHEWFTSMRGGEKCVEALCEVFPEATLFALVHVPGSVSPTIEKMPLRTSFVQHLPFSARRYRHYLPLFPAAVRRFDLSAFDLVISSHHCVAKGVRVPERALHICYCHTPMRYLWHSYDEYFGPGRASLLTRLGMGLTAGPLRRWDVRTASSPRWFVANSENVRRRIREIYRREADVIYPPVETARFPVSTRDDGYFLVVSALVPYKRIDLAVEVFNRSGDRLVVVGDGPELPVLRAASRDNVRFLGWQSDRTIEELMAGCTAVLFPGEEDFGIVPVEAMAAGKPVIAYAAGGALETVIDTPSLRTGVLFPEQTPDALREGVVRFRETSFDPQQLHAFALGFDREVYKRSMREYILDRWAVQVLNSERVSGIAR
jgi:glycosyltransferase involved in cell wall biosynthesis